MRLRIGGSKVCEFYNRIWYSYKVKKPITKSIEFRVPT